MKKYALMLFYTAGELSNKTLPSNAYLLKETRKENEFNTNTEVVRSLK